MAKTIKVPAGSVAAGLVERLIACRTAIDAHRLDWDSSQELMRLFAGLYAFYLMPTISVSDADRRAVNTVFRARIGLGSTWHSCLKLLSGARARAVFAKHGDVIRAVGGSKMMLAFNQIMPTLPDVLAKIDREIARVA